MKKNFFKKKLASALALALVVASVSPVSASAATAAKIVDKGTSTATAVLYVDKVAYGKSAVNFDLSKTYAGTTYTWTVSDSKKATIGAKTGYVVAKAPGVVKVTVTAKKGKTTTKFTQSVTIRKRATAVAAGEDVTLKVGETKTQAAVVTPSNTTDAVKYVSDKPEVAKVDAKTGAVTAVKTGEATITVYAKAASSAPDSSKYNVSDSYKVTVTNAIAKVAAVSPKKLAVTFAESLTGTTYTKDNFTVLTSDTSTKNYIQTIETSTDGKTVTLTFYSELTSGKTYDVTATFGTLTLKGSVPFVKGAVAKIDGSNQIVKAGVASDIVYNVYDENGLNITDSTTVSFQSNVAITNGKITLANGVLAYVTVVYTNPTTGAQIKSATFTVTGSNEVATSAAGFTLSKDPVSTWPTTVSTSVALGTNNKYAYVKTTDQYGKVTIYGNTVTGATYESLDPSIFVVDGSTGKVTTIKEGTGQFKVTVGNVTQIYSLTVTATAKAASIALDSSSVLKASLTSPDVNVAKLLVNLLDQNSEKYAAGTALTATLLSGDGIVKAGSTVLVPDDATKNTITLTSGTATTLTAVKSGVATFKITANSYSLDAIVVTVTVYAADDVITGYGIDGAKDLDIAAGYDASITTPYQANLSVVAKNAGGFTVSGAAVVGTRIDMTKPNGTVVTGVTLVDTKSSNVTANATATGKYTLTAYQNGIAIGTTTFTVSDTGTAPNVYLTKNTIAQNVALSTVFNLDGAILNSISFVSGDSSIFNGTTANASVTKLKSGSVILYNVVANVTKNGRTFDINTGANLTVTD